MAKEKKNTAQAAAKSGKKSDKRHQLAALCWRLNAGQAEVLLITSRETGRWVVPKGWPMKDRSPWEAAATEAWEEAGVLGRIEDRPLGQFCYEKFLNRDRSKSRDCKVDVYPLRVEKLADDFPEQAQRRREWFTLPEAAAKVDEQGLQILLSNFGNGALGKVQALDPIEEVQARA